MLCTTFMEKPTWNHRTRPSTQCSFILFNKITSFFTEHQESAGIMLGAGDKRFEKGSYDPLLKRNFLSGAVFSALDFILELLGEL